MTSWWNPPSCVVGNPAPARGVASRSKRQAPQRRLRQPRWQCLCQPQFPLRFQRPPFPLRLRRPCGRPCPRPPQRLRPCPPCANRSPRHRRRRRRPVSLLRPRLRLLTSLRRTARLARPLRPRPLLWWLLQPRLRPGRRPASPRRRVPRARRLSRGRPGLQALADCRRGQPLLLLRGRPSQFPSHFPKRHRFSRPVQITGPLAPPGVLNSAALFSGPHLSPKKRNSQSAQSRKMTWLKPLLRLKPLLSSQSPRASRPPNSQMPPSPPILWTRSKKRWPSCLGVPLARADRKSAQQKKNAAPWGRRFCIRF